MRREQKARDVTYLQLQTATVCRKMREEKQTSTPALPSPPPPPVPAPAPASPLAARYSYVLRVTRARAANRRIYGLCAATYLGAVAAYRIARFSSQLTLVARACGCTSPGNSRRADNPRWPHGVAQGSPSPARLGPYAPSWHRARARVFAPIRAFVLERERERERERGGERRCASVIAQHRYSKHRYYLMPVDQRRAS
jgi:hypothetical protein